MHNHPKILLIFLFFNIFVSCEQNESSQVRNVKSKTKEERLLEKQERDKARQQMFAERKVKYKNMLSENRESGDIRGIWYMEGADIKNMRNFLNADIKYSDGYCIQVSDDMKNGKVFFLYTDKVFDIKFEKVADTKYVMIYMNKKRIFNVIKYQSFTEKDKFYMGFFYEDFHKYDPTKDSRQAEDGSNFFDYCTSGINDYECSVEGCLGDIKERDEIYEQESKHQPLGVQ